MFNKNASRTRHGSSQQQPNIRLERKRPGATGGSLSLEKMARNNKLDHYLKGI
jgi:hypothetical protein